MSEPMVTFESIVSATNTTAASVYGPGAVVSKLTLAFESITITAPA